MIKTLLFLAVFACSALAQSTDGIAGPLNSGNGTTWYQAYTSPFFDGGDTYQITVCNPDCTTWGQGTTDFSGITYSGWNANLAYMLEQCNLNGDCSGSTAGFVVLNQADAQRIGSYWQAGGATTAFGAYIYNNYSYFQLCRPDCPPYLPEPSALEFK
jgi:hypothetical protein